MGFSQHAGMVILADGTDCAERCLKRVLFNDPATGIIRHTDAGYAEAAAVAKQIRTDLMNEKVLIGPFKQVLTMDGLKPSGHLTDDNFEIIEDAGVVVERGKIHRDRLLSCFKSF